MDLPLLDFNGTGDKSFHVPLNFSVDVGDLASLLGDQLPTFSGPLVKRLSKSTCSKWANGSVIVRKDTAFELDCLSSSSGDVKLLEAFYELDIISSKEDNDDGSSMTWKVVVACTVGVIIGVDQFGRSGI